MEVFVFKSKFTEKNLCRAYNREVADIISIIRHAEGGELLTVEQRVNKAVMKVRFGRSFTDVLTPARKSIYPPVSDIRRMGYKILLSPHAGPIP
jgi:hypothetical protein